MDVPDRSALRQWSNSLIDASKVARRSLDGGHNLKRWYIEAGFVDVHEKVYKIPLNGWPRNPNLKRIGEMWHKNLDSGMQGFSYALLHRIMGMTKEQIEVRKILRRFGVIN